MARLIAPKLNWSPKVESQFQNPKAIGSVIRAVLDYPAFKAAQNFARQNVPAQLIISGLTASAKALLVAAVACERVTSGAAKASQKRLRPILAITADKSEE